MAMVVLLDSFSGKGNWRRKMAARSSALVGCSIHKSILRAMSAAKMCLHYNRIKARIGQIGAKYTPLCVFSTLRPSG